jgi:hypothetical protein
VAEARGPAHVHGEGHAFVVCGAPGEEELLEVRELAHGLVEALEADAF